jgi:hypothetical protein
MLGSAQGRGQAERAWLLSSTLWGFVRFRTELYANEQSATLSGAIMRKVNQAAQLLTFISVWPRICRTA